MTRRVAPLVALLLVVGLPNASRSITPQRRGASAACEFSAAAPWIGAWLQAWEFTSRELLELRDAPPPEFVFFDSSCVYTTSGETSQAPVLPAGPTIGSVRLPWRTAPHGGTITMPDSSRVPVRLMSFAAPKGDSGSFFVMAAPDFWAQAGVNSEQFGRERLLTAVFLHEFAHTRQMAGLQRAIAPLEKAWAFPQELNDDVVQQRFGSDPAYAAAFENERDLLYQAAAAAAPADVRALAAEALGLMRARHARWFTGENEVFRSLDDLFLAFEGAGQWTGYAWLAHQQGGGVARDLAVEGMRRGGRRWSQDEGLALFLVVDRLLPGWPGFVFDQGAGASTLLERAVGK